MSDLGMPYLMELETPERCAALCRELGLDFVELNISFPACQLSRLTAEELRALSARYGVYFTLHMDEEADPFAFNAHVREAWLKTFRDAFALCREAGVPVINMHLPRGIYITLDGVRHFMFARYREEYLARVDALREMCEQELVGTDIRVCIENTSGFLPHETEAVERLLRSPVFGLTLDIGHAHASGGADLAFMEKHRDRLRHMHAHDCAGTHDHLALGCGEIDLPKRLALAVVNDARILLEIKTVASLWESAAKLRRYAPRAEEIGDELMRHPVRVRIDRPMGSCHPRKPGLIYPVNYGEIVGVTAGDGAWQDAYVLGLAGPVKEFTGRVAAVIHRSDDVEEKWIVLPEGVHMTADEMMAQVHFVEQFFDSHIRLVE